MCNISMLRYVVYVLMMYYLVTSTDGYSIGAPMGACDTMTPSHGAVAQTSPSSYTITPSSSTFDCGESISITLSGGTFKGFLCQARLDVNGSSTVGTLEESDGSSSTTNKCAGKASITQNSGTDKTTLQFTWTHSGESTEDIYIVCTVVQTQIVFWENVASTALTYSGSLTKCNSSGSGGIISSVVLMCICIAFGAFKTFI
ncbi:putative defense protein 3 [Ruditapes philippinarum]|uniref:putative defense protein 3 n=1 Tax=Ruditapes philippinarum TaxID=129788 RepID=UPI00295BED0F|nr:putative defense protein 3 [Ruditapes philippinarum]